MQPFWPRHSLWSRSHLRLSERRLLAIILHISVRELERQLLSQPAAAVDNDAGHLKLLASRRGQLFVFRISLASIYNISISASHDNCTRSRLRNCLANLPQNNLSAHCRCRRGQNGTAAIDRSDSGLQNATFHCLFGPVLPAVGLRFGGWVQFN